MSIDFDWTTCTNSAFLLGIETGGISTADQYKLIFFENLGNVGSPLPPSHNAIHSLILSSSREAMDYAMDFKAIWPLLRKEKWTWKAATGIQIQYEHLCMLRGLAFTNFFLLVFI